MGPGMEKGDCPKARWHRSSPSARRRFIWRHKKSNSIYCLLGFQLSSSWKWKRKEQVHLSSICLAHRPCFLSPREIKKKKTEMPILSVAASCFSPRKFSLSFLFSLGTLLLRWSCGGRVSESWWKFVGKESFCSAKKKLRSLPERR